MSWNAFEEFAPTHRLVHPDGEVDIVRLGKTYEREFLPEGGARLVARGDDSDVHLYRHDQDPARNASNLSYKNGQFYVNGGAFKGIVEHGVGRDAFELHEFSATHKLVHADGSRMYVRVEPTGLVTDHLMDISPVELKPSYALRDGKWYFKGQEFSGQVEDLKQLRVAEVERERELDRARARFPLGYYLQEHHYDLDRKATTPERLVFERGFDPEERNYDRIALERVADSGAWRYVNLRDPADSGSADRFIETRESCASEVARGKMLRIAGGDPGDREVLGLAREIQNHSERDTFLHRAIAAHERHCRERTSREEERRLSLPDYAAARLGFVEVGANTDRSQIAMLKPSQDLGGSDDYLVFTKSAGGQWAYRNERHNPEDRGDIRDFAQRKLGLSAADVERDLSRFALEQRLTKTPTLQPNAPALNRLGLRPETLDSAAFRGSLRHDPHQLAAFDHGWRAPALVFGQRDRTGALCGVAALALQQQPAGAAPTLETPAGSKGVWISNPVRTTALKLVIVDTPFTALAHHQLQPQQNVRYVCPGPQELEPRQREALKSVIDTATQRLGRPPEVAIATTDREIFAERLTRELKALYPGLSVRRESPPLGKDWGQALERTQRDYLRDQGVCRGRRDLGR